jgi:hypothetical protein
MTVLTLCHTIMMWGVNTRYLMDNAFAKQIGRKSRLILFGMMRKQNVNFISKLSLNFTMEILKYRE